MLAELGSSGHAVKTPELVAVAHCEGGQGDRPPSGLGKQPARLFDIFRPKTQRKCKELQQKLATILAEKRQEFGEPLWVVSPLTRALQTFMEALLA
ncbi:hypothetical protein HaLaN_04048 [Haematococcus lacustris]|uniref:Uncharacterized protein n=1 Tax=Haematococcus lacustris TaxID=44745 RepID=A0A699Z0V9_HAELA|nr:hypothetical protein HaLaN_04048 [Haematococcus lacustris]